MSEKLPLACVGDKTTTGGVVLEGANQSVRCDGKLVAQVGGKATCSSCKKGWGIICRTKIHNIIVEYKPAALAKYIIDCDCPTGTNRIVVPEGRFSFAGYDDGMIGMDITQSQSISLGGVSLTSQQVMDTMVTSSAVAQTTTASAATQSASIAEMTRQFNEVTQDDLREDLKTYLEEKHTQVCILSVEDAAKCALNIWAQKQADGETIGTHSLKLLDEIKQHVDAGVAIIAASKLSLALGGLGITVKQFIDSANNERIIISSLWNDKKMHYAVVNGLNVKKNHPYLVTNPTVKQLGLLAQDTIKEFKKGAVLSFVISATVNTNELIFNDDYHLVDWCGDIGEDLFKAMTVLAIGTLAVSLAVTLGITYPVWLATILWVGLDYSVGKFYDGLNVSDSIVEVIKSEAGL